MSGPGPGPDAPEPWEPAATQPLEVEPEAPPPSVPLVSETAASEPLAAAVPEPAGVRPASGLDALFATEQLREYREAPAPVVAAASPVKGEPPRLSPMQRVLLIVLAALVALLALVALFALGTRLPQAAPSPTPTKTATPSPTPVPTVLPPGPVAAGTHRWDQLLGGECLDPFTTPWAEQFTVVDCAAAHPAQLVFRGRFADPSTPGYPGAAALQVQMSVLCSAPGVIDLAAAAAYTDAQVQASYPATAEQWDAGDHWYYCFVNRASGQPLTGSVAVPPAEATPSG